MRRFLLFLCLFAYVTASPCPFGLPGSCVPLEGLNKTSNFTNPVETNDTTKNETTNEEVKWVGIRIPIQGKIDFPPNPDENLVHKQSAAPAEADQQQVLS